MMLKLKEEGKKTNDNPEESVPRNISHFGPSIFLKGELSGEEDMAIEGHFKGKINFWNNNILIGQRAKIEGDIRVKSITVQGSIVGNILASGKVFISKEGRMKGDITSPVISIMDGAKFVGSIKMGEDAEAIIHKKEKEPEHRFY